MAEMKDPHDNTEQNHEKGDESEEISEIEDALEKDDDIKVLDGSDFSVDLEGKSTDKIDVSQLETPGREPVEPLAPKPEEEREGKVPHKATQPKPHWEPPRKVKVEAQKKGSLLPLIGGILIVVLAVVAIVYFLVLQNQANSVPRSSVIVFKVEPGDADILLNEQKVTPVLTKKGETFIKDITPGKHEVVFKKSGYVWHILKDVQVYDDKVTNLNLVALSKLPGGSIAFKVNRADVEAYVNDEPVKYEKIADGRLLISNLEPGEYTLKLVCKDCESVIKDGIKVTKESSVELNPIIINEKLWKQVEIAVTPVEVNVYFNNKKVEAKLSPKGELVSEPVEPGKYRVQISKEGYVSYIKDDVEVYADISTTIGPIVLEKNTGGRIIINTNDEIKCKIDNKGVKVEERPDKRKQIAGIKPGKHILSISREGYPDLQWDKLMVFPDRPVYISYLPGKEMKGKSIILSTDPGEVNIYLDDQLKGKTSVVPGTAFMIEDVSAERHVIKAELEGSKPWIEKEVIVDEEKPTIIPMITFIKPAILKIEGKPEDAEVQISGRDEVLKAPCTIDDLPAGEYIVKIKKKGFKEKQEKVSLNPQEEKTIIYELKK